MSTTTRARQTGGGRVTAPRGGGGPQAAFACLAVLAAVLLIMEACTAGASSTTSTAKTYPVKTPIKHVIVIMQENRSFDTYFGTFPGADGLPRDGSLWHVPRCRRPAPRRQQALHDLQSRSADVAVRLPLPQPHRQKRRRTPRRSECRRRHQRWPDEWVPGRGREGTAWLRQSQRPRVHQRHRAGRHGLSRRP